MNGLRRRHVASLMGAALWARTANARDQAVTPASASAASGQADDTVRRGRTLAFPRDHGAHAGSATEWWYATGWAGPAEAPTLGFQITFFRSRTGLATRLPGRLAPRQLLFAHAAFTDLAQGRHVHADRLQRWNGQATPGAAVGARADDAQVWIGPWALQRRGDTWQARVADDDWQLELELQRQQPLLLQGDAGFSRKGPDERQASHYYSEPQLDARGLLRQGGRSTPLQGRAWLDHEWSDEVLAPDAVGWDWIGMNGLDGSALTAFRVRRADGSALWAGGSHRAADGTRRVFGPDDLRWQPGRRWHSRATGADYPVQWTLHTPVGVVGVRALLDAQELDARRSTGTVYWEGLSELSDAQGRRIGLGYLEMTGYAGRLRL